MNITISNRMRRVAGGAILTAASALVALGAPAVGHAEPDPGPAAGPGMGCETIHTGAFNMDRRKVCDGPKQRDGTWQRTRTIWTPTFYLPSYCVRHSDYDYSSSGRLEDCNGRWYPQTTQNQETYPVTADTVLPDEPGWLPPYTYNIL